MDRIFVPLGADDVAQLEHLFRAVVVPVMAVEHMDEDGRNVAYIDIRDSTNRVLSHTGSSADGMTISAEAHERYGGNAAAKNDALEERPDIKTSWQVHRGDTSQKPYPGGIRTAQDDRIAISGFTWERDTIGCLWLAYKLGRMTITQAAEVATICGIRSQFIKLCHKLTEAKKALPTA